MSKILFLRGAVPSDRDPKQIMFDNIDECDDMWTQLCRSMVEGAKGYGEVWYIRGQRTVKYSDNLVERWLPTFTDNRHDFNPDIIFARGGFQFYDDVLKRHPNAFKIYYGAGFKRVPSEKQFRNFDLILVDTPEQLISAKKKLPKHNIQLLVKPAADNIFKPAYGAKHFDAIMVGNYNRGVDKGHDLMLPRLSKQFLILSIGKVPKKFNRVTQRQWIPRKDIPKCYSQAKVAIVCCGKEDSCPRVIPEALACNCPILVLERVNLWKDKYINKQTGMMSGIDNFANNLEHMINHYEGFSPYDFYKDNLSLAHSSMSILKMAGL